MGGPRRPTGSAPRGRRWWRSPAPMGRPPPSTTPPTSSPKHFRTVASPASFNNRMGLARAINDHLGPGTEVFVAEMGTYGPGEIADLCKWVKPDVSAIVAIGPVHLERFKSEENILAAKSEILEGAGVGVIAIDHPLLNGLARSKAEVMELVTVSAGRSRRDDQGRRRPSGGGRTTVGRRSPTECSRSISAWPSASPGLSG